MKLLTTIAATLTGPRYNVAVGRDFEWSNKSWTHNAFRVFELLFGRKYGIRLEATSGIDGDGISWVIAHSFEASVAYTETFLRNLFALPKFKLVKVYVPQLAFAGMGAPTSHPYMFAIAFDVASNSAASGTNTVTWSHTCTGSNLTLTTECCQNNIPTDSAGTTTYNSVTVPDIVTFRDATNQNTFTTIGGLGNPATGANNVTFTATHTNTSGFAMSLTGTNTASPGGASNTLTWGTVLTSQSLAVTTTFANSWIVDNTQANAATVTATGTGQTRQVKFAGAGGNTFIGSTTTTTTAGSYTISYNFSSGVSGTIIVGEIRVLAAVVNKGFFFAAAR